MKNQKFYKIEVIWLNGEREFLQMGATPGRDAVFMSLEKAKENVALMFEGMAEEVQSISVVLAE